MPAGRPSDYTQELADTICLRLADGESLRAICRDDDMPAMPTVWRWLYKHPEFGNQYARAREEQAETLADEILSIADESQTTLKGSDETVVVIFDSVAIARNKLRIDTRKWIASKLKPKTYGDKLDLQGTIDHSLTVEIIKFSES